MVTLRVPADRSSHQEDWLYKHPTSWLGLGISMASWKGEKFQRSLLTPSLSTVHSSFSERLTCFLPGACSHVTSTLHLTGRMSYSARAPGSWLLPFIVWPRVEAFPEGLMPAWAAGYTGVVGFWEKSPECGSMLDFDSLVCKFNIVLRLLMIVPIPGIVSLCLHQFIKLLLSFIVILWRGYCKRNNSLCCLCCLKILS